MITDQRALFYIPFASSHDRQTSPRYYWDNANRSEGRFVIIQYTHSGRGIFSLGGREYSVGPGQAFVAIVPEQSHYYYPRGGREPWVFSWLNFYDELGVSIFTALRERTGPIISLQPPAERQFESLIRDAKSRTPRDPFHIAEKAYRFILNVMRHQVHRPDDSGPIDRALAHLRGNYQQGIRVKELALMAGMSREHFTRLFLAHTGKSPAAFLREIRLDEAAVLVRSTDVPVKEIAFRCGLISSTKLGTYFRRKFGASPTTYRKKHVARCKVTPTGRSAN